jgi:ectoine hydroxylase-related dioxygenase (phytanoyl-CoA dioxygenase family)
MRNHPLPEHLIEHYRTEGYVVVQSLFDRESLAAVEQAIRELTQRALESPEEMSKILELEPTSDAPVPRRIFSPYDQHPAFRDLAHDNRLVDAVESLIGPNINLQHSKLNMKPAKVGSPVEWHQDMAYFPHTNDDLVTTLIYLDDATQENGCLQVLPRRHTHYFNHSGPDGRFAGMITEDLSEFGTPRCLAAPAGSVIFMHCITPHSSLPNLSTRPRRTLIYEYRANDSFPIYYGEMTNIAEARFRPIRGVPARFARFGGPRPPIPNVGTYTSLYELQSQVKKKRQEGSTTTR